MMDLLAKVVLITVSTVHLVPLALIADEDLLLRLMALADSVLVLVPVAKPTTLLIAFLVPIIST